MTSTLPLEILDLRHYSAKQLRPVLDQETRVWDERLNWDFRASADLLLQYLDSHILPGYVALEGGEIAGYVFCVYEESKAVIGDVFAAPETHRGPEEPSPLDIENRLLEFLIELLQNSPGVDRIESQLLLHPHAAHEAVFHQGGFDTHQRLFMELVLKRSEPTAHESAGSRKPELAQGSATIPDEAALPPGLSLRAWHQNDFNAAARLIAAAYQDNLDSLINDQYRTVAGSLRFLHNIVRFPGCGIFDAAGSFVITGPDPDELAGLLLCSRVREDVGHVTQLCVTTSHRGQGLATRMLKACIEDMKRRGVSTLTLTVTEANAGAVSLYRTLGFREKHTFDAMVWERPRPGISQPARR